MKNVLLVVARGLLKAGRVGINGPERRTFNSIDIMKKNNYFVAYSKDGYFFEQFKNKIGTRLIQFETKGIRDIFAIYKLYKIIKKNKIDVVHVQGPFASDLYVSIACKLSGAKAIITRPIIISTDSDALYRKFLMRILDKVIFTFSAKLVTISEKSKDAWIKENAPIEKLEVVYNGTFLDRFSKKIEYKNNETINCIMVAQFIEEKNHIWFLENVAMTLINKYKNLKFIFVGDGYTMSKCNDFVQQNKIEKFVKFTGNINNVNEVLSDADISFLPSKKEGVPVSLIESIASGLPIISNNIASVSEVCINEYNGYLIDVNDKQKWILSFEQLIENENLREKFGTHGRELAEKQFDIKVMIEKYERIYEDAK